MTNSNPCKSCAWEVANGQDMDDSKSRGEWSRIAGIGETSVRRHLSNHRARPSATNEPELREKWNGLTGELDALIMGNEVTKEEILALFGHDPKKVAIVGTLEETHWMMAGTWQHRYRYKTERIHREDDIDPVGILAQLRSQKTGTPAAHLGTGGDATFVVSINDIQLGQGYNGGSKATIENFHRFIETTKARISELRLIGRKIDSLVVIFGGDLVEGCFIYPHQSHNIDLNRKEQIEGVVALGLHALDELAPMFSDVRVLACKGNHGENRVDGKKTTLGDNDDTHAVEMMKLALSRDPNMAHIREWVIAREEAAVWLDVHGWTLVTTHGDIYAKGVAGPTTERKAHAWFKNMAAAVKRFGRIGQADVLITHHFHHDELCDWGDTLWRQTRSQDRGSPEFSQATGTYSDPGMLTFVMSKNSKYSDEFVIL